MECNIEVRRAAGAAGVRLWQIAERLKMPEATFSRKLRREFPTEEKQKILALIDEIAEATWGGK